MAEKNDTLVHPDGREWTPTSATERTNLLARGWAPKGDQKKASTTSTTKADAQK